MMQENISKKKRSVQKETESNKRLNSSSLNNDSNGTETKYHKANVYHRFGLNQFFMEVMGPIALFITIPTLSFTIWYICAKCNGDLNQFVLVLKQHDSFYSVFNEIIFSRFHITKFGISVVTLFFAWAIFLTKLLPGKTYKGPVTINGNQPEYIDNGLLYHIVNTILFFIIAAYLETIGYSVSIIYDRYDEILVALNVFGGLFCWFLYFKGIFFPSSSDYSISKNVLFDYYWGVELHPRIFDVAVKLITNCRFGMSAWFLVVVIFCWKCFKVNGFVDSIFVTTLLIGLYLTKFFHWESGYMKTMDVALDRAGFYICYGCICWVPAFYTLPAMYLVTNPIKLGFGLASTIFICGLISLYLNYAADHQKQEVRATNGNCLIWGEKPKVIEAKYILSNGEKATSLLLICGYWSISRHFHYVPEILLAFFWSVPSLFDSVVPYFYLIFLTILLFHRSVRDDNKCSKKYGKYWDEYCKKVPYRIIPFVF